MWTADEILEFVRSAMGTVWYGLTARVWGVRVGAGCIFDGPTHFKRYPTSTVTIGANCRFRSSPRSNFIGLNRHCALSTHAKGAVIQVGRRCGFSGAVIAARERIVLGEGVLCGANVTITDFDWHVVEPARRHSRQSGESSPVEVGDNVWLGMNVLVLKGVTIGANTVIGANSVVLSSLPPDSVAAGIPAHVVAPLSLHDPSH
jgi:NDP-sugar pyrophosphorylase family protein